MCERTVVYLYMKSLMLVFHFIFIDWLVEKEGDGRVAIIILDDRGAVPKDLNAVLLIPIVARPLSQIGALPIGVREYDEVGPVALAAWATRVSSGSATSTHQ